MGRSGRKVLLVCNSKVVGGTEQVVKMLGAGLQKAGTDCQIMTPSPNNNAWFGDTGIPVSAVPSLMDTGENKILGMLKLAKAFRPFRDGVVNIHYPICDPYNRHFMALKLSGCKRFVVSTHHPLFGEDSSLEKIGKTFQPLKNIVVTTPNYIDFLVENGVAKKEQMRVILPGVAKQTPMDKMNARELLGLPKDKFIVGAISRIEADKRHPLLIDAVVASQTDVHLAIGGQGASFESVAGYGSEKLGDRFSMLGWMENSQAFYSAIDALVLLSSLEGFGLVFAEAAGHGVPSVGCKGGGISNAIIDGETGFIVDNENPVPEAGKIIREWSTNPGIVSQFGKAAKKRYESLFIVDRMVKEYKDLFDSL